MRKGKTAMELCDQWGYINGCYPFVVDDDRTRNTVKHIKRAEKAIRRYNDNAEAWLIKTIGKTLYELTYEEATTIIPREVYMGLQK